MALVVVGLQASMAVGQAVDTPVSAGEVLLNLVVHDNKNKPVLDLRPEEIEVTENGSPVALTGIRLITGKQESKHLITLVIDRAIPVAGAGNQADPFVIRTARAMVAKILKLFPQDGFVFSVLNVEERLRLQQGFTSDRKALEQAAVAAIEAAKPEGSSTVNQPEKELLTVALRQCAGQFDWADGVSM
jgi:hypothetical protein